MISEIRRHVRHNFVVNVLDGSFFGLGMGFASYITIMPLFVSQFTDSAILIGLIGASQQIGWQLPQLLMAGRVSRLSQYKYTTVMVSLHERFPYFGLALVALAAPAVGTHVALILTFLFIAWQALGAGFTATAWQSMVCKIIPSERRGTFYGVQSAGGALLMTGGAVAAGIILTRVAFPQNFALCFLITGIAMIVSWLLLSWTREPHVACAPEALTPIKTTHNLKAILQRDSNFRWFLVARYCAQFASMAIGFYTFFAVERFNMDAETLGIMTGVALLGQTLSSPIIGWAGDKWGHRRVFAFGNLMMAASAFLALTATQVNAFYLVFALAGIFNSVQWTTISAMVADFGTEQERPFYIGLSNTLVGPATLVAPVIGGWLAETAGFGATFGIAIVCGIATAVLMTLFMHDPKRQLQQVTQPVLAVK